MTPGTILNRGFLSNGGFDLAKDMSTFSVSVLISVSRDPITSGQLRFIAANTRHFLVFRTSPLTQAVEK